MNNAGRIIAKNASFLMASQIITWGLTMVLTIFLPRYLGVASIGQFHLANSLWAIVSIIAAFGMDLLLTKEIAREAGKTADLVGTSLVLRLILYLVGFSGIGIYVRAAGYPQETTQIIYLIGVMNLFLQLSSAFEAALKGLERMELVSVTSIITKAIITIGSVVVLLLGYRVYAVIAIGVGAAIINLIIQAQNLKRVARFRFQFHTRQISWMLKASFPYLMVTIFLVVYQQIDIIIISLLVSEKGVGLYGAADQLFGTLLFIPTVFITAVYPALSRAYTGPSASFKLLMEKSFYLLLLACVPIGLGLMVVADQLVVLLFGSEFASSGPILAVMGLVLILTSQNMLLGQFMIAIDRQKIMVWIMAGAAALTIPLDILLVPWSQNHFGIGALGGALSYLTTETIMMVVILAFMPREMLQGIHLVVSLRSIAAGLVMVAAIWWSRQFFIAIPILLGAGVYTAMIALLKAVPQEDMDLLRNMLHDLLGRWKKKALTS